MNSTTTFFVGITVQIILGILQVAAAVVLIYRWQRPGQIQRRAMVACGVA